MEEIDRLLDNLDELKKTVKYIEFVYGKILRERHPKKLDKKIIKISEHIQNDLCELNNNIEFKLEWKKCHLRNLD